MVLPLSRVMINSEPTTGRSTSAVIVYDSPSVMVSGAINLTVAERTGV